MQKCNRISVNPAQLCEVEVNFIAEQIQRKLKTLDNIDEKADLIFKFLNLVNEDECAFFKDMYDSWDYVKTVNGFTIRFTSQSQKEAFVKDVEETGFYLVRPPHKPLLYDDIKRLYNEFDWIKPVDVYINLFGMKRKKMLRPMVVGYKYMIILKQNSNKNFSARSTYRINRSHVPAKDVAKKTNKTSYAKTPVRLSEIYNPMASVSGRTMAEWNIFMRSSFLGRKSLDRILTAEGNPTEIVSLKVRPEFINSNADIINARLKAIGLRLRFNTQKKIVPDIYQDVVSTLQIGPYTIMDKISKHENYVRVFYLYEKEFHKYEMIETYPGQKSDLCWDKIFELEEVKSMGFSEEDKEMLKNTTKSAITRFMDSMKASEKKVKLIEDVDEDGNIIHREPKKRGRKPKKKPEEETSK